MGLTKWGVAGILATALLSGCTGEGLDAKLSTVSEAVYRPSLNNAWANMTESQRNAFNWSVSNLDLPSLNATFPDATPREIISKQTAKYETYLATELTKVTAEYAQAEPELRKQEEAQQAALQKLAGVQASDAVLTYDSFYGAILHYTLKNASPFDISILEWTADVYLNGAEQRTASVRGTAYLSYRNGLDSGKSARISDTRVAFDHHELKTPEMRRAKSRKIVIKINPTSIKDLGERTIYPTFKVDRDDYTRKIEELKSEVQATEKMKASLKEKPASA